ncbi:MAG: hypothetical protein QXH44_03250 [Pyrobaculum sp.]
MNISTFVVYIALALLLAAVVVLAYVIYVYLTEEQTVQNVKKASALYYTASATWLEVV